MSKPKKKVEDISSSEYGKLISYNQACSDWEKHLPSMDELKKIGIDLIDEHFPKGISKERGEAIVLYAQLIIKIFNRIQGRS